MEFFSQFDCKIVYVSGERNSVADALSRRTDLCSAPISSAEAILGSQHPYAYCADTDDDLDLPILCVVEGADGLDVEPAIIRNAAIQVTTDTFLCFLRSLSLLIVL
ncbi:hypothetical protein C8R41DRAFT_961681 [Lentinula lateritia]|uniref:RNase H type-1 domain-containing protein n=1 Tax=Lentinula lateritia TaxID=40482 RepID=A0ABQ8V8Q0_9AGAR|nr:hypothetical protein C8R41DRAFT_961681 [Lentinula lateritia]